MATETLVRQKAAIRRKILDRRQSQDPEVRADHSRRIIAALLRHEAFIQAKAILVYLSKDEEVGTDALLADRKSVV